MIRLKRKFKKITGIMMAALLVYSGHASADVNNDMGNFFKSMGFQGNASRAQAWQGQEAGYLTGGSLYLRSQTKNLQLFSMQMPSLSAGCGGIDSYLGAFSFMKGAQLQQFIKSIMGNAEGYFFDLALTTMVPEMKQVKDYLQNLSTRLNSMNINSCQAAQGIVGTLWPRTQVSQQKVCQDIAGQDNIFADWAGSRQGCTTGGQEESINKTARGPEKDRVIEDKNITWDALSTNGLFSGNQQLKEFMMSLTGSIIFKKNNNVVKLPSLANSSDILKAMLHGGKAKIYLCDETVSCLAPTPGDITISKSNALINQVHDLLEQLDNSIIQDTPLTDFEKGFVNSTSVPVVQYLTASEEIGMSTSYLIQVSEFIAEDILLQYLRELVDQTNHLLSVHNYDQSIMEQMTKQVDDVNDRLFQLQSEFDAKRSVLLNINNSIRFLHQQVTSHLTSQYQGAMNFEGGV